MPPEGEGQFNPEEVPINQEIPQEELSEEKSIKKINKKNRKNLAFIFGFFD